MKFGLAVGGTTDPKLLEKWAVKAEELGYDCFLVTDHFMGTRTNDHFDVWTFLPYLAAKTRTIRLGTCVTPIPFRPPAIFAKMISTADILSNGRIILGAGSGWFKPEFDGYSRWMGDKERVAFTKEAIDLMIRLWTVEGPVNYKGRFVSANGAVLDITNPKSSGKKECIRAIEESASYVSKGHLSIIESIVGRKIKEIIFTGGGAKGFLWPQILADVLNVRVRVPVVKESTALGAAICAGVGAGFYQNLSDAAKQLARVEKEFQPSKDAHKTYERLYQNWRKVYDESLRTAEKGLMRPLWKAAGA